MDKKLKTSLIWPAISLPVAMVAFLIDWRAALIMLGLWIFENKLKQKNASSDSSGSKFRKEP